jgi:predicted nucleic acid-binding protein
MTILVDTNVLIDVLEEDPEWFAWSSSKLEHHKAVDTLAINQLILAEVSIEFADEQELHEALPPTSFHRVDLPWKAAFTAGHRFLQYRRRGGKN